MEFVIKEMNISVRLADEHAVQQILHAVQAGKASLDEILTTLNHTKEQIMTQLSDLQAKVDKASTDAQQAFTDGAAKLDALAQQVSDLQAQIAAGNGVDPAELAAVSAELSTQSDALEAAAAAFEGKVAPPAPAPTT